MGEPSAVSAKETSASHSGGISAAEVAHVAGRGGTDSPGDPVSVASDGEQPAAATVTHRTSAAQAVAGRGRG
ncbi:hypothetical protein [Streptomyces sp. NPDC005012]|uniref:hypothetical protein n=1 Tax=Streptomyces sp. NPDC005012 TaxID=3154558 RepID=UPI0033AA9280